MADDTIVKDVTAEVDRAKLDDELRSDIAHILKIGEWTFEMVIKKLQAAIEMFKGDGEVLKKFNELGIEYGLCRDVRTVLENEIKELMNGNNVRDEIQNECYRVIGLDLDVLTHIDLLMENAVGSTDDDEFDDFIATIRELKSKLEELKVKEDLYEKLLEKQTRKRKISETAGGSVIDGIERGVLACTEELEYVSGLMKKHRRFEVESWFGTSSGREEFEKEVVGVNKMLNQSVKMESDQSGDPMNVETSTEIQQLEHKISGKETSREEFEKDDSALLLITDELEKLHEEFTIVRAAVDLLVIVKQNAEANFRKLITRQLDKESVEKVISDRVIELKGQKSEFESSELIIHEKEMEIADLVKNRVTPGVEPIDHEAGERMNRMVKN